MRPPKYPVVDGKKQCSKCGMSKPHTLEFFRGPRSTCRSCEAAQALKRWREKSSVASGGNEAWAKRRREYYYSEAGRRSYRRFHLKQNFGLTLEEYEELLRSQEGVCALCSTDKPKGRGAFHVDHDHLTGLIRGLLCHACNSGLGSLGDDPVRVARAVKYLRGERLDYRPNGGGVIVSDPYLKKKFGLQNNACAICQGTEARGRANSFHIDHNHTTGAFRGLLCHMCNVGIGSLQDDPILLERAVNYLRESSSGLLAVRAPCVNVYPNQGSNQTISTWCSDEDCT